MRTESKSKRCRSGQESLVSLERLVISSGRESKADIAQEQRSQVIAIG
jgi:hypothetical protein